MSFKQDLHTNKVIDTFVSLIFSNITNRLKPKLYTMTFSAERDSEFNRIFFDDSETEKLLLRASVATYEKTGTYVFLKLFKRSNEGYECVQRLTRHIDELVALFEKNNRNQTDIIESKETMTANFIIS